LDEVELNEVMERPGGQSLVTWAIAKWEEKQTQRRERFWQSWINKTNVRLTYQPTATAHVFMTRSGKQPGAAHWFSEPELQSPGVLTHILRDIGVAEEDPIALRVLNTLPYKKNKNGVETSQRHDVPREEWEYWHDLGYVVTKGKLLWRWKSQALDFVRKALPTAQLFAAYGGRLHSPLLPDGYLKHRLRVCAIQTPSKARSIRREDIYRGLLDLSVGDIEKVLASRANQPLQAAWELHQGLPKTVKLLIEANRREGISAGEYVRKIPFYGPLLRRAAQKAKWEMEDQGVDGSCLYDPNHPAMAKLVERYGSVVFQFTGLNADGWFFKGLLVPREGINDSLAEEDQSPIHLALNQVKGTRKEDAAKIAEANGVTYQQLHIGVMRCWSKPSTMASCFELPQLIGPTRRQGESTASLQRRTRVVETCFRSLIREGIDDIVEGGIDAILTKIAKDDEQLSVIVQLVKKAQEMGIPVNPLGIPLLKSAVDDHLSRRLWRIAQGGNLEGQQLVTVLDKSVPEGCCVAYGFKPGEELAFWRFPMIAPQALVVLKNVRAKPWHKIDGRIIRRTIFMNPKELVDKSQGDDDGDFAAVTNDPRIVALFKQRADSRVYLIEPEGVKYKTPVDSEEGRHYLMEDPLGLVGIVTMMHAQLYAIGDLAGARALSVHIQENVDAPKRAPQWSDPRQLLTIKNWHKEGDRITAHGPDTNNFLDAGLYEADQVGGYPLSYVWDFIGERKSLYGAPDRTSVLGWQSPAGKRIHPSTWKATVRKQAGWAGGNWVHFCHDYALEYWNTHETSWAEDTETIDLSDILTTLLQRSGFEVQGQTLSWDKYLVLRKLSGLDAFGQAMAKILRKGYKEEEKLSRIETITHKLHERLGELTIQQLLTIWNMETTTHYKVTGKGHARYTTQKPDTSERYWVANSINHAFRAVCNPNSPLLPILGIETPETCDYLARGIVKRLVEKAKRRTDPVLVLANAIISSSGHVSTCSDEPKDLWECPHCTKLLQTALVGSIRQDRTAKQLQRIKEMVHKLNSHQRQTLIEDVENRVQAPGIPVLDVPSHDDYYDGVLSDDDYQPSWDW
jgi:hypothetical protein